MFHHPTRDLVIVVPGDDFTALGCGTDLNWYEDELRKSFETMARGRIVKGCNGDSQIRILNRVVTLTDDGVTYEADPRHCDILMDSLNLTAANSMSSPGAKPSDRDEMAIKPNEDEQPQLSLKDPKTAIAAILAGPAECTETSTRISSWADACDSDDELNNINYFGIINSDTGSSDCKTDGANDKGTTRVDDCIDTQNTNCTVEQVKSGQPSSHATVAKIVN